MIKGEARTEIATVEESLIEMIAPSGFLIGTEIETLTNDAHGDLSQASLPLLGHPLRSPFSYDFGASQREIQGDPHATPKAMLGEAYALLAVAQAALEREGEGRYQNTSSLPFSRLPRAELKTAFEDVPLREAQEKAGYRARLGQLYGVRQLRDSVHTSMSFSDDTFVRLAASEGVTLTGTHAIERYKNDRYMGVARGLLADSWAFLYLFGSSISVHSSALPQVLQPGTTIYPFATALKQHPDFAYRNKMPLNLNLDSWEQYTGHIDSFVEAGTLLAESEVYDEFRLKADHGRRSVSRVESRIGELNVFSPTLIHEHMPALYEVSAYMHLVHEPSRIDEFRRSEIKSNMSRVAAYGRHPDCFVQFNGESIGLSDALHSMASKLLPFAQSLDRAQQTAIFSNAIAWMREAAHNYEAIPSGQLWNYLSREPDHIAVGKKLSEKRQAMVRLEDTETEFLTKVIERIRSGLDNYEEDLVQEQSLNHAEKQQLAAAREFVDHI